MSLGLEAFHQIGDLEHTKAISYLRNMVVLFSETTDSIEGRAAFMEKGKSIWKDLGDNPASKSLTPERRPAAAGR